ncbi:hypothetical protein PF007_g25363 [Phytophthora fragariae]|uniref:Integrase catalytic domain-containing protein n=1 Tax=Phytophthora fragariae TaxID=53985 RepID=A0A6A3QXH6_9STRA|nr:hypothetical protein PF003_g11938 [Phytophthora fragariae]KAE8937833.1 hypothetical protein PF009_g12270 [Phytophthora fragariae]KAE9074550.1 hypothetical protein PF007_g25363 [Phytophthora fragariae]KAE9085249.1 hypothetical protein PF006_g26295 [Phytophthora fragariae]KAE9295786.1 hypothetical protein PF001_g17174 [Phytophthora fragariae]
MAPGDRDKTAFTTKQGLYRFVRMPFGLMNTPSTFQRMINGVLRGLTWLTCLVYLDDIVVFTRGGIERHIVELATVLERLSAVGLTLKLKKCMFATKSIEYLGHELSCDGVRPVQRLVTAVAGFSRPTDIVEVKRFVHLACYYRKFTDAFGSIMAPMTRLLKKDQDWEWTEAQEFAFERIKAALTTKPLLVYPDFVLPFRLVTDASKVGLGACLMQDQGHGWQPIAYASKVNSIAESTYSITELECFAVVWSVKLFRPYLYGRMFVIITDHSALKWLMTRPNLAGRLHRWSLTLQEYEFEIEYRPGATNVVADALSRAPAAVRAVVGRKPLAKRPTAQTDAEAKTEDDEPAEVSSLDDKDSGGIAVTTAETEGVVTRVNGEDESPRGASWPTDRPLTRAAKRRREEAARSAKAKVPTAESATMPRSAKEVTEVAKSSKSAMGTAVTEKTAKKTPGMSTETVTVSEVHEMTSVVAELMSPTQERTTTTTTAATTKEAARRRTAQRVQEVTEARTGENEVSSARQKLTVAALGDATLDEYEETGPAEPTLQVTDKEIADAQQHSRLVQQLLKDGIYQDMKIGRAYGLVTIETPHGERVVLPPALWAAVFEKMHGSVWAGHLRGPHTYGRVARLYWWPRLQREVNQWVRGCQECGSRKAHPREVIPPLRSLRGGDVGDRWALDVAGPFPVADGGERYVIAALEYVARYAVAKCVTRHTAENVAVFLVEDVVLKFGVFRELLTDRAPEMVGKVIEQLVDLLQAKQTTPVPYRPQMIGLVERFHRSWKDCVSTFMSSNTQDDWNMYVKFAVYVYNSARHTTVALTQNELMMGRRLRAPNELLRRTEVTEAGELVQYHKRLLVAKDRGRACAEEARIKEQSRQARYYNRKVRQQRTFAIGDPVWLYNPPRGPKATKFVHQWMGPMRIVLRELRATTRGQEWRTRDNDSSRVVSGELPLPEVPVAAGGSRLERAAGR